MKSFAEQIELLTGRSRRSFERPLVTRYLEGDQQRRHFDARVKGDSALGDFTGSGQLGQRLVQCVVYLNDVPTSCGGETSFLHPDFRGLKVGRLRINCAVALVCFRLAVGIRYSALAKELSRLLSSRSHVKAANLF
jgi:hypothetical protein